MAKQNVTNIDEQLNSLRSVLRSDDNLQIQTSGDYERVRLKLDHDLQVSFLFDALTLLNEPLTTKNVNDLRLSKFSSKCPLNSDQWQSIKTYFDGLMSSNNSEISITNLVQLIQDHLLEMSAKGSNSKNKPRKNGTTITDDSSAQSNKFRGADLIFSRILHDPTVDRSQVLIGYEDRFTGIHEIAFNEFKKVHEHEYGVPMHRIRHYKINDKIVWDRTKKIDVLTGSDQGPDTVTATHQNQTFVEGLYQFNLSLHQWVHCPHIPLTSDENKTPSTSDVCLPERCHFLTWNILFDYHHSKRIHTAQRYLSIVETLKSLLPDVICLQEVTMPFLTLLLNQSWLQENNYFLIIMQSVLQTGNEQSYGQLLLTKNFRPRSFSICSMDLSEQVQETKTSKQLLVARFGLNAKVTIDLVNTHLHSNRSKNAEDKRCQVLENLFAKFSTKNYMLIGDFNFGDYELKETNILRQYQHQIHDLWRDIYDLEQSPGFTFDPANNICAKITSDSQIRRRLDRYLIHTLPNLYYSVEHLSMIATETIPIDPLNADADKRIHQSDHFALQLILNFRTRLISHRSALVVLPTIDRWQLIEPFREQHDPSYKRWPPHINVLWPFFDLTDSEDDEENILLPLRLALANQSPFNLTIEKIETFQENGVTFMKPDSQSNTILQRLFEQLKQLFPQCCSHNKSSYHPHLTIAQASNEKKLDLKLEQTFEFPVKYLYILQRSHNDDTSPFQIAYQLPLGPVLEQINSIQLSRMNSKIGEFFQTMNLYENEQSYHRKRDKLKKITECVQLMFNNETLHCFTHQFLPYGSFRLGIDGQDLDAVFVLREDKSVTDGTNFDTTLRQLKDQPSALTDRIVNLLETQIKGSLQDEIVDYRNVQALFPMISIIFKDRTQVEIFVDVQMNEANSSSHSIHGVHDIERLISYVRSPPLFQHLLTFIRNWAKNLGLYGLVFGYLGGFSWAVLCASVCHSFLSTIESLSSIEEVAFEQFFTLVRTFFATYSRMNWSLQNVDLHRDTHQQKKLNSSSKVHDYGSMRILSPSPPYHNTARTTTNSTRDLIHEAFQDTLKYLDSVNTLTSEEQFSALCEILRQKSKFPNEKIQSLLELTITAGNQAEFIDWIGWIKSRLPHFLSDCEKECRLNVQPSNSLEHRSNPLQTLYSIGFQTDVHTDETRRNFPYYLKKFLDQCSSYTSRKDSMAITHRLISIGDWKLERMQPKSQRVKK